MIELLIFYLVNPVSTKPLNITSTWKTKKILLSDVVATNSIQYLWGSVRATSPYHDDYTQGTSSDIWLTISLTKAALIHSFHLYISVCFLAFWRMVIVPNLTQRWRLHSTGFIIEWQQQEPHYYIHKGIKNPIPNWLAISGGWLLFKFL